MIAVFVRHGSAVALHALLALQGVLAAFHMVDRALLHLLPVVAGIADILMAELTFHVGLLGFNAVKANVKKEVVFRLRRTSAARSRSNNLNCKDN